MDWWFPHSSGRHLALSRMVIVGALLVFFFPSLTDLKTNLAYHDQFMEPQMVVAWTSSWLGGGLPTTTTLTAVYAVALLSGILTLVGFMTRPSALVLSLSYWWLVAFRYSFGDVHHPPVPTIIFLLLIPLTPCNRHFSLDAWLRRRRGVGSLAPTSMATWPLRLMQVVLALIYFDSAMSKLTIGGLEWMNGHTLQANLLHAGVTRDWPLALTVVPHLGLCKALSVGTILFEGLFFTVLFHRRLVPFWLSAGVAFHLGLVVLRRGDLGFLAWVVMYVVFLRLDRWTVREP